MGLFLLEAQHIELLINLPLYYATLTTLLLVLPSTKLN